MSTECKRGEIYLVNWNPGRGSEQAGIRPALIIQNDIGNKYSPTIIIAAVTNAGSKTYPFIVAVKPKESGLERDSFVNLAQIMTVGKERLAKRLGELSDNKMLEIDEAIKNSLALTL